jgi:hypothetical protein
MLEFTTATEAIRMTLRLDKTTFVRQELTLLYSCEY